MFKLTTTKDNSTKVDATQELPTSIRLKIDYSLNEFVEINDDIEGLKNQDDIIRLFDKYQYNLTDNFVA